MLKTNINKAPGATCRVFAGAFAALAFASLLVCWQAGPAYAEVFFTVRGLLADQFKQSERVTFVHVRPTPEQRRHLEQRIGHRLAKDDYVFYVASTHGKVDGYALFDEERGQHELIGFGTFFDADGRVTRVEVTAYREPYGDGIRAERFRKQFVGRNAHSSFAPEKDIDAVSGATISSRSMCAGVERASALLEETLLRGSPVLAAR
jgi:Na+-translocating ferredoxin:NAD+ oxidoreductase RnfG subunit